MMKKLFYIFFVFQLSIVFSEEEDFDLLMGKETPAWQYLQTREDDKRLSFFRTLFQRQMADKKISPSAKVPNVIHFIWLGPANFPLQSIERVEKWIELHPGWIVKFWTDLDRPPPHPCMQKCLLSDFPFKVLGREYYDSINFGEKSKILAYEILLQEGGIYIDHDTIPHKPFQPLNCAFDFYCGLENLGPSVLSSSVIPSPHLIAAKADHPILRETVFWLQNHWDQLEESFPGKSMQQLQTRILHRSFWALSEGIDHGMNQNGNVDVVFPAAYFSGKHQKAASYASHYSEGKWCNSFTDFEQIMHQKLQEMIHKNNETVWLTLFLAGMSFLGCAFLLFYARSVKKRSL